MVKLHYAMSTKAVNLKHAKHEKEVLQENRVNFSHGFLYLIRHSRQRSNIVCAQLFLMVDSVADSKP